MYNFVNDDAKYAFIAEPHNFLNVSNIVESPPLRVYILGPPESGKSIHGKMLAAKSGALHVDFDQLLDSHIKNLPEDERQDIENSILESGVPPSYLVNELSLSLFKVEPWCRTGFIAENFPRSKANAEYLQKQGLSVDVAINLKIESDVLCNRIIRERRVKNAVELAQNSQQISDEEIKAEIDEIYERIDKQMIKVNEVITVLESNGTIPVIEVDASRFLRPISAELNEKLKNFIDYVNAFLTHRGKACYQMREY